MSPISHKHKGITIYPTEAIYRHFGQRVKVIRELLGMTQVVTAKKLGLTRTSLTNIEAGRQRVLLHSVIRFSKVFRVKPDHLLKGIWKP